MWYSLLSRYGFSKLFRHFSRHDELCFTFQIQAQDFKEIQDFLPVLKTISESNISTYIKQLCNDLYVSIATHGAVNEDQASKAKTKGIDQFFLVNHFMIVYISIALFVLHNCIVVLDVRKYRAMYKRDKKGDWLSSTSSFMLS